MVFFPLNCKDLFKFSCSKILIKNTNKEHLLYTSQTTRRSQLEKCARWYWMTHTNNYEGILLSGSILSPTKNIEEKK